MATYVMLGCYSAEGLQSMSKKRTEEATALVQKFGGQVKAVYALLGKVDILAIADFPSTKEAMQASLGLTKLTGISFSTSPAVTVDEFDKMIQEM